MSRAALGTVLLFCVFANSLLAAHAALHAAAHCHEHGDQSCFVSLLGKGHLLVSEPEPVRALVTLGFQTEIDQKAFLVFPRIDLQLPSSRGPPPAA